MVPLNASEISELRSTVSNITVVSARLSYSGNVTSFSITIKNSGSEPVVLYAVRLFGEWQTQVSVQLNSSAIFGGKGSHGPVAVPVGFNGTFTFYRPMMFFVYNGTLVPFPEAPFSPHGMRFMGQGMPPMSINYSSVQLNFTPPVWHGDFGIVIQPGQEVTLNFTGVITPLWHGWHFRAHWVNSVEIYTVPLSGAQYSVRLMSVPPTNSTYYVTAS